LKKKQTFSNAHGYFLKHTNMNAAYFKTTFRSLWRNKGNSFLNIFGLAIGIACAGLIFLWAEDELTYDSMHTKRDRLYQVLENQKYDAYVFTHGSTPAPMAPAMQAYMPGIAATCRASEGLTSQLFTIGDKPVYALGRYAEPSLFTIFTLPFVQGNAKQPFSQLHSLVLTETAARKFFGETTNVVGKTVRVDNKQDYVVSGVVKDIPANSSYQFEWVAPFQIYYERNPWLESWGNQAINTFVELEPGVSAAAVNKLLYNIIQQHDPESITRPFLFSMKDWRLYGKFENGKQTGGRIEYVRLFSLIAWIILGIACINFMNLATARSEKRAREVGMRKVLGASKRSLVVQFIGEAFFMAALAAFVALVLILILLPAFNTLVQKSLALDLSRPAHSVSLLLITLVCGLVAGSYPSLYLSSFNPVFVFKGIKLKTGSAAVIRKGLVVLQFTISIVLIIGTIIIFQQIQHVKSRPLGFEKENLIEMNAQGEVAQHFSAIRQELLNTGMVENAALSDHATIDGGNNTGGMTWQGKPPGAKILISGRSVSPEFVKTSGLKVLQGRDLQVSDSMVATGTFKSMNVLITQSLATLMGTGSALGRELYNEGDPGTKLTVIGVVNDYVYGNMYGKPDPVIFNVVPPQNASVLYVRIKAQQRSEQVLAKIEAVMKRNNPAYPFDYRFVDDQFNQMFLSEMLMSKLARVFAALAILISCLGLFGLASYTAERRTKEIGIRKVLGASVPGIAGLLSKDFLQLVLLSCGIAFPLAWWAMHNWLQDYQYRVNIQWWVFAAAGILSILIALATVSFQAVKAAIANPGKKFTN
jgi:putative ABC transport system permease protein